MKLQPTQQLAVVSRPTSLSEDSWQTAVLIRTFEERLLKLFSEGRIFGTVHTCIGQEFTGVAVSRQLVDGDLVYSNHRGHGHYLARTHDVDGLMAEIMGRQSGVCGGRGGSQHVCHDGFFSNGIQGGIVPVSAGLALAQRLRETRNICVVYIGDGTLGEGVLYETLNIASKWDLPLLIAMENNLYAQSTSQHQTLAGEILDRPAAFGIKTFHGDTWNLDSLFEEADRAVNYVRTTSAPAFLRMDTYRLMAHSKGDDDRDSAEVKRYWAADPITRLQEDEPELYDRVRRNAVDLVEAAVERADESPFTEPTRRPVVDSSVVTWAPSAFPETSERLVARIYAALRESMEQDPRIVMLGEDIEGPYGGAFKVTKDLSQRFPDRVRNTPISEGAIVGLSNGLALAGMIPVCEIMFGDFMTLAMDQILNHAAKFRYMYNDQVKVPVVVRTPMGGKRGYGATHSQSLEKHFLGIPDVQVLALHHKIDPYRVYRELLQTVEGPTVVIENKLLYGHSVSPNVPEGFVWEATSDRFPTTRLHANQAPDLTIVCYGGSLVDVEKAVDRLVDEHDLVPDVIVPLCLFPLQLDPIIESVSRSRRLLIVEEGQEFCGFGAEVLAAIQQRLPGAIVSAGRHAAAPSAIPSCKPAEDQMLPGVESIVASAIEVATRG